MLHFKFCETHAISYSGDRSFKKTPAARRYVSNCMGIGRRFRNCFTIDLGPLKKTYEKRTAPGDYEIRRCFADRQCRTATVLFVTVSLHSEKVRPAKVPS